MTVEEGHLYLVIVEDDNEEEMTDETIHKQDNRICGPPGKYTILAIVLLCLLTYYPYPGRESYNFGPFVYYTHNGQISKLPTNGILVPDSVTTNKKFTTWFTEFVKEDMPIITYKEYPTKEEINTIVFHREYIFPTLLIDLYSIPIVDGSRMFVGINLTSIFLCNTYIEASSDGLSHTITVNCNLNAILHRLYNGVQVDIDTALKSEHEFKEQVRKISPNFDKVYFR